MDACRKRIRPQEKPHRLPLFSFPAQEAPDYSPSEKDLPYPVSSEQHLHRLASTPAIYSEKPCMQCAKPLHVFRKSPACNSHFPLRYSSVPLHSLPFVLPSHSSTYFAYPGKDLEYFPYICNVSASPVGWRDIFFERRLLT